MRKAPPETCPNCGADVPRNAKACPECGSDESTGWSDRARADHLGIPDDDFDYDEFVASEFGGDRGNRIKPRGVSWLWWVVAVIVIVSFIVMLLPR